MLCKMLFDCLFHAQQLVVDNKVTTCLENLEMSGILTTVGEMSGKKSCQRKLAKNCLLLVAYLRPYGYLEASS